MNYGKSGGQKPGANAPRFDKHKETPQGKDARGGKASKADADPGCDCTPDGCDCTPSCH